MFIADSACFEICLTAAYDFNKVIQSVESQMLTHGPLFRAIACIYVNCLPRGKRMSIQQVSLPMSGCKHVLLLALHQQQSLTGLSRNSLQTETKSAERQRQSYSIFYRQPRVDPVIASCFITDICTCIMQAKHEVIAPCETIVGEMPAIASQDGARLPSMFGITTRTAAL